MSTGEVVATHPLTVTRGGIEFAVDAPGASGPVDVLLDGRRVWSFRGDDAERVVPGRGFVPWPEPIVAHLSGRAEVALRAVGHEPWASTEVAFTSDDGRVRFADEHGRALVVNKWGHAGRVLDDHDDTIVDRLLDHAEQVRALLVDELGLDVFATGGTLLGPVRDGRLIGHDDDADLAWASRHVHPLEVAREGFALGRALRRAGFDVVRHSPGHVQMHFSHRGLPDHYVDVFAGWFAEGFWHQVFCIRHPATRDDLLPPRPMRVAGHEIPAPRTPEIQLEANYGPGWRVPDPAFRFDTPPEIRRRLDNWFPGLNWGRDECEEALRAQRLERSAGGGPEDPAAPSSFASWVAHRAPAGAPVLDLGCGNAVDARWFASSGRASVGVDWAREALRAVPATEDLDLRVLNLHDPRTTIALGAELAARRRPWAVVVRRTAEHLGPSGRAQLLRLCSMVLRCDGRVHLEVGAGPVTPAELVAEAGEYGLRPEETVDDGSVTRMVMAWTPHR